MESSGTPSNETAEKMSVRGVQPPTMQLNVNKAGMQGLDTERINKIIEDASRGSKFYVHKQQRQQKIDERIQHMLQRKAALSEAELVAAETQMAELSAQLELRRDLSRFIVHVDMDAFFAAVEMRDRPELRNIPMAVGSTGMLSTSNYLARRFGIRSAMPGFIGRKLCPQLVIVPCNFAKYRDASQQVQQVLARYDPEFSMCSLDEAYLDVTSRVHCHLSETAETTDEQDADQVAQMLVARMRSEIEQDTQLTASAGIACNGMLAKICSDQNKPNGQYFLPRDRSSILAFLSTLPCRKVSGIGNVTSQLLSSLEVSTCGDLLKHRHLLPLLFSESSCHSLLHAALGVRGEPDDGDDDEPHHQKSISSETTFSDTASRDRLLEILAELCSQLADDVRRKQLRGRTITVKVKTATFNTRQRSRTLPETTSRADTILTVARQLLLRETAIGEPLRLLGVRLSSLTEGSEGASDERQMTLDQMSDRVGVSTQPRNVDMRGFGVRRVEKARTGPRQVTLAEMMKFDLEQRGAGLAAPVNDSAGTSWEHIGKEPVCDNVSVNGEECATDGAEHCARVRSCDSPSSEVSAPPVQELSDPLENCSTNLCALSNVGKQSRASNLSVEGSEELPCCPVCAKRLPTSLALVNQHVDECLNQKLLSELVDGAVASAIKRPASKPASGPPAKHKRIESFFSKS